MADWNRCTICGKFIGFAEYDEGATHKLITPDSEFTCEEWETICVNCNAALKQGEATHERQLNTLQQSTHRPTKSP